MTALRSTFLIGCMIWAWSICTSYWEVVKGVTSTCLGAKVDWQMANWGSNGNLRAPWSNHNEILWLVSHGFGAFHSLHSEVMNYRYMYYADSVQSTGTEMCACMNIWKLIYAGKRLSNIQIWRLVLHMCRTQFKRSWTANLKITVIFWSIVHF